MIRSLAAIALGLSFSIAAHADQSAAWSCTGKHIKLQGRTTYFGEDSKYSQTLYSLSSVNNRDESSYTAYFLNVEEDFGRSSVFYLTGQNEVGGKFQYIGSFPKDDGDGTIIRRTSEGTLTYNHGSLKGRESVSCVFE